jgi:hypothetical protein
MFNKKLKEQVEYLKGESALHYKMLDKALKDIRAVGRELKEIHAQMIDLEDCFSSLDNEIGEYDKNVRSNIIPLIVKYEDIHGQLFEIRKKLDE